jgi:Macrocin-O-methyltransferase (TylF).
MSTLNWREGINHRLADATGYQLVRARRAQAQPPDGPGAPKSTSKRPKPKFRRFHDEAARATMRASKPWTMTSYDRLFALIVAVRYVEANRIDGDIVECGVWRGGSMQAIARTLLEVGCDDRELHLFDTFEGMPPPSDADRRISGGPTAKEMLEAQPRTGLVWAVAGLEDVKAGMAKTAYPTERIHYHQGRVQDTIPGDAPERIALLRLDTDWYESTRHELEHLYDRLSPGGVLIIDDYDYWEGSRKAVDEFIAATNARLLLVPIDTGRIAVKP